MAHFSCIYFILGLVLRSLVTGAQIIQLTDSDSLRRAIGLSRSDIIRVNLLLALAHQYIFRKDELAGNMDTALLLSRQAGEFSHSLNYYRRTGLSYRTAVHAYRGKKELKEVKPSTMLAKDSLNRYGSPAGQADACTQPAACAFRYAFRVTYRHGKPVAGAAGPCHLPAHHLRRRSGFAGWI